MTLVVLDTNVISEAMRGAAASPQVIAWLRSLAATPITTVVNRAEILAGIALLAPGQRRTDLRAAAESVAAEHYAQVVAHRRDAGRPIGGMDALIAAITRQNGAALATRDIAGFAELGIDLIDPWAYRA